MNHDLNPREIDVLKQLSEGKACKEFGNIQTIHNQLVYIRLKLNASSTIQAVAIAIRRGII